MCHSLASRFEISYNLFINKQRGIYGMKIKQILSAITALVLLLSCLPAVCAEEETELTVLFTSDLHSHFLPVDTQDGGQSGGYARLASLLNEQRKKYSDSAIVTVDGGDFGMGSLFQTVFTTDAAEFRILGQLGYDATTFGNHEFDFRQAGLAEMLNAAAKARSAGETLPEIVQANYWPDTDGDGYTESDDIARDAFESYGVKEYTIIEREGVKIAVFGLLGADADGDSPLSGMHYEDIEEAAKRVIDEINADGGADYVICLSHTGIDDNDMTGKSSEDYQLAKNVDGIDVIISGHTHSTLTEPMYVNGTYIVCCGSYAENLGVLRLNGDKLIDYELIPVDETVAEDKTTAGVIDSYKNLVSKSYLSQFEGMTDFDEIVAHIDFDMDSAYGELADKALGNLLTEAYIYGITELAGTDSDGDEYTYPDAAFIPCGVIRGSFTEGDITVSDAFDVLSLGVGADGTAGYPIVSIYLTGKELKLAAEIDASISPLMSIAQLYSTGLCWNWSTNRMLLNKVTRIWLTDSNGNTEDIEDNRLYHIVTGQNCVQMLGKVTTLSKGLISVTPKDKNGNPIDDGGTYDSCIVHAADGSEVKEWFALASYLMSFDDTDGDGVADVPQSYRQPKTHKVSTTELGISEMLVNWNAVSWIALAAAFILIFVIILIVTAIVKSAKKKAHSRSKN